MATVSFVRGTRTEILSETGEWAIVDGKWLVETDQGDFNRIYFDDGTTRKRVGGSIAVDDALSDTSTNPVENNVIYDALILKEDKLKSFVSETGTTKTLALTDVSKIVLCTNTSALTITVPLNSSVAFSLGTTIRVIRNGSGTVTFLATGGVTINSVNSLLSISNQYDEAYLIKTSTDTWSLILNTTGVSGGGESGTVLWTNLSPTSSFSGQTVTLSETIANFEYYEVEYAQDTSSNVNLMSTTGKIPKAYFTRMGTFSNSFSYRNIPSAPSGTAFAFSDAVNYSAYSGTAAINNALAIPRRIIGYTTK